MNTNDPQTRAFLVVCRVILAIGFLNFAIFVAFALYLGGDAVNGKAEGGHYYLFGVASGTGVKGYTEVSQAVFDYSRWHVYSVFVTWPLALLAAIVENRVKKGVSEPDPLP